jgi:hypothetical protein
MAWEFEMVAGPFNPRLTEGPAWDGKALLFTHIPASRILRYDPATGECTVFREHTNHTNGLAFDSEGRLYGCCSGGRSIVRFEPDGTTTTIGVAPLPTAPSGIPTSVPSTSPPTAATSSGSATLGAAAGSSGRRSDRDAQR